MTDSTAQLTLWHRIVAELAELQDSAPPEAGGSVVNPIRGLPYVVDTCCAAAVFAVEYRRTGDGSWKERAGDAMRAARDAAVFSGVSEPMWDQVHGWRDVPDSLPATAIAVDAYWDALARLAPGSEPGHGEDLLDLLSRCRTPRGGFAHNAYVTGEELEVQNATAEALYVVARSARGPESEGHPLNAEVGAIRRKLRRGQAASGFWPHYYPGKRARLRDAVDRTPFKALLRTSTTPDPAYGGELMHHLMTLYFAARYVSLSGDGQGGMLTSAWRWTRVRLVPAGDRGLAIDWSDEPAPRSPELSNRRDTNAYFLILGALPHLVSLGVVEEDESDETAAALLDHVASHLMSEPGHAPCVVPHEAPPEVVSNFLPMFEQSAAWKGALLAEVVMTRA